MKTLMLTLVLIISVSLFGQEPTPTTKSLAEKFISSRVLSFDENVNFQYVSNLQDHLSTLSASDTNYTYSIHSFLGKDIDARQWLGLACKSRGGGIPKPFVRYSVYTKENVTYVEVLFGNDYW